MDDHTLWLKKFKNKKEGKLFELRHEVISIQTNPDKKLSDDGAITYLAAALSIATKGTKMESDAIELIKLLCPEYFIV